MGKGDHEILGESGWRSGAEEENVVECLCEIETYIK